MANFFDLKCGKKIIISQIPSSILGLKYNGYSPLEWAIRRSKTRIYKTSDNIDDIREHFKDLGENPEIGYLAYLKKIITVSINTEKLINRLNNIELIFVD